jgi:flavin-dependent dehydrogenase
MRSAAASMTIAGSPRPSDGVREAFCPRRIVLDDLLVQAAVAAGAELREAFSVDEILLDDGTVTGIRGRPKGGATVTERARIVVGADGRNSLVAKAVRPQQYNEAPALQAGYYAYWSGLPTVGAEFYVRGDDRRGWGALPTHDDLTCVIVGWPRSQFEVNRKDYEHQYVTTFDLAPELPTGCAVPRARRGSQVPQTYRASFASLTEKDGCSSATRVITRIL